MTMQLLSPEDKVRLREDKIAQIQDQIGKVERRMMEQSSMVNKLEHLHKAENRRTQRIMDRLGKKNYVINDEVERLYGRDLSRRYSDSPVESAVVEDIIYHRNKEHTLAQQDTALRMRYLAIERQRLQDARERLRDRRNNLRYAPTPVGKETRKAWGDKYNIYCPLGYDEVLDIYSPRYSHREPFLPRVTWGDGRMYIFHNKKRYRHRRDKARYVAVPASTSMIFW